MSTTALIISKDELKSLMAEELAELRQDIVREVRAELKGKNPDRMLNLKEAATYLGVSAQTLYRWAQQNKIGHYKTGSHYKFSRQVLDEYLESTRRRIVPPKRKPGRPIGS